MKPSEIKSPGLVTQHAELAGHMYDERGIAHVPIDSDIQEYLEEIYNDIPVGFALIGGAARDIAFGQLRHIGGIKVRDVDIVDFREHPQHTEDKNIVYSYLSRKYMPADFEHGYGVKQEDHDTYFQTRDFTINQIAVIRDIDTWYLEMTRQAVIDTHAVIIRPTVHAHDSRGGSVLPANLAVKAVLLEQVLISEGLTPSIKSIDMKRYAQSEYTNLFSIALGLQKACDWGGDMPTKFFESLTRYGFIDDMNVKTVEQLLIHIEEATSFDFTDNAQDLLQQLGFQDVKLSRMSQRIGESVSKSALRQ